MALFHIFFFTFILHFFSFFLHQQAVDGENDGPSQSAKHIFSAVSLRALFFFFFDGQPEVLNHADPQLWYVCPSWTNCVRLISSESRASVDCPSVEMMYSHILPLLDLDPLLSSSLLHLNDHSVFPMFGLIGKVWFLCASVPNKHLEKTRRKRVRNFPDSENAAAISNKKSAASR